MGTESVSITDISLERLSDYQQLSATVDGERIWYKLPADLELVPRPEVFLAPALFEAMVRGVPVQIEDGPPVSKRLLHSLVEIQSILNCWNKDLNIVPIHAQASEDYPATDHVACCFSGGIDSSYTYSRHRDAITHLLLVQGFASGRGGPDDWHENIEARWRFAESENKSLIAVHTNVMRFLSARNLSILLTHGAVLGGLGAGLGLKQLLIPASYTFSNLMPWGSHPMLDPLWSTETMTVVHHGADASRIEKTAYIAKHQYMLDQLQVCWYAGGRNCGACGKCMRTALALYLLGGKTENLPPYRESGQLKLLKQVDAQGFPYLSELAQMAEDVGEAAIARRLRQYLRSYRFHNVASEFAREIIGERGRALIRRIRPHAWHNTRGALQSVRFSTHR
jgi:hypothetical protein